MMSAILDSATRSVSDRPAPFGAIDGGNVCRPTRSLTSRTAHRRQSSRAGNPTASTDRRTFRGTVPAAREGAPVIA